MCPHETVFATVLYYTVLFLMYTRENVYIFITQTS